jgi:hypothetical protein
MAATGPITAWCAGRIGGRVGDRFAHLVLSRLPGHWRVMGRRLSSVQRAPCPRRWRPVRGVRDPLLLSCYISRHNSCSGRVDRMATICHAALHLPRVESLGPRIERKDPSDTHARSICNHSARDAAGAEEGPAFHLRMRSFSARLEMDEHRAHIWMSRMYDLLDALRRFVHTR